MANDAQHYRILATRAQAEADAATLDNVRDRALRSAAAFETMALQHEITATRRAEREARAGNSHADSRTQASPVAQSHREQT